MRIRAYEVRVIVTVIPVCTLTHIRKGLIVRSPRAKDIKNFMHDRDGGNDYGNDVCGFVGMSNYVTPHNTPRISRLMLILLTTRCQEARE